MAMLIQKDLNHNDVSETLEVRERERERPPRLSRANVRVRVPVRVEGWVRVRNALSGARVRVLSPRTNIPEQRQRPLAANGRASLRSAERRAARTGDGFQT